MSPEYAMDGVFSTKSDVFSFGVLVLEIVSGKKNRGFYHNELDLNLLRYVSNSTIYSGSHKFTIRCCCDRHPLQLQSSDFRQ